MSRTFHASTGRYIVATIAFGILPLFCLPLAMKGVRGAAQIAIAGLAALLFAYFWLSRFKLTLTPQSLTYHSLWTERTIRFSDITASEWVIQGHGPRQRTLLQLTAQREKTRINIKVFSSEAQSALVHLVGPNHSLEPTAELGA